LKFLSLTSRPHLLSIPSTCNNNQGRTFTIPVGVWPVIKRFGHSVSVFWSNKLKLNLLYLIEQSDGQVETAIEETSR
jgi:hypothetical protein